MSHGKQFTLYSHAGGPNGWKVAMVLAELGLEYETIYFDFGKGEHKANEHVKLNPNGRIPTLVDHKNGDFVVWESNAIILYLVDKYDQGNKISAGEGAEKYQQLMWLFFQSSGQGPYFGQGAWFKLFHSEQLPSAQERYYKEILRVFGVLEDALQRNGSGWLVGNKRTIADISFIPWDNFATGVIVKDFNNFNFEKDFPRVAEWHKKSSDSDAVRKVLADKEAVGKK